jgi:hypothetical protein
MISMRAYSEVALYVQKIIDSMPTDDRYELGIRFEKAPI